MMSLLVATPIISPPSVTGRWWVPRSPITSIASNTSASLAMVRTGDVITSRSGACVSTPFATTRERKSRSVTIPGSVAPVTIKLEIACSSISRAPSAMVAAPSTVISRAPATSSPTGVRNTSDAAESSFSSSAAALMRREAVSK